MRISDWSSDVCSSDLPGDGRRGLDHQADPGAACVERHAISEDEEQDQRQHEGDQDAARVADDLIAFLADQRGEPARPVAPLAAGPGGNGGPDHAAACLSDSSTSAMKASSIVGSGKAGPATLAFSSSGEPSARSEEHTSELQ